MEGQQIWHHSFMLTWILVFHFPYVCSGVETTKLELESTVFVAFTGDNLNIRCVLTRPANLSRDVLTCYDPSSVSIYSCDIPATAGQEEKYDLSLELKNLTSSGEYSCQYKTAKVFWFLRVRSNGYKDITPLDYTEFITVSVFTGVLLVFSVVGSVCVFRGHWREYKSSKQNQNSEERKGRQMEQENVDVVTSPSTSFYASLEPRPRSIYDVLDHSAANTQPDQSKTKHKKKEHKNTMAQTTQPQHENVCESVYENF